MQKRERNFRREDEITQRPGIALGTRLRLSRVRRMAKRQNHTDKQCRILKELRNMRRVGRSNNCHRIPEKIVSPFSQLGPDHVNPTTFLGYIFI